MNENGRENRSVGGYARQPDVVNRPGYEQGRAPQYGPPPDAPPQGSQYSGQYPPHGASPQGGQRAGQYPPHGASPQGSQHAGQYPPNYYAEQMIPLEVRRWNWGAFALNWIWGCGNGAFLALLCLIPGFNIIWMFVCGARGNVWAWQSGKFKDLDTFLTTQLTWNVAGIIMFCVNLAGVALVMIMALGVMAPLGRFAGETGWEYEWY